LDQDWASASPEEIALEQSVLERFLRKYLDPMQAATAAIDHAELNREQFVLES
jgi:hypothetical protein